MCAMVPQKKIIKKLIAIKIVQITLNNLYSPNFTIKPDIIKEKNLTFGQILLILAIALNEQKKVKNIKP